MSFVIVGENVPKADVPLEFISKVEIDGDYEVLVKDGEGREERIVYFNAESGTLHVCWTGKDRLLALGLAPDPVNPDRIHVV